MSATEAYTWAIRMGIAKEQARAVLPEGNTHTRLYMTGTLYDRGCTSATYEVETALKKSVQKLQ